MKQAAFFMYNLQFNVSIFDVPIVDIFESRGTKNIVSSSKYWTDLTQMVQDISEVRVGK